MAWVVTLNTLGTKVETKVEEVLSSKWRQIWEKWEDGQSSGVGWSWKTHRRVARAVQCDADLLGLMWWYYSIAT